MNELKQSFTFRDAFQGLLDPSAVNVTCPKTGSHHSTKHFDFDCAKADLGLLGRISLRIAQMLFSTSSSSIQVSSVLVSRILVWQTL